MNAAVNDAVSIEYAQGIATLTIKREESANSIDSEVIESLDSFFTAAAHEQQLSAVIITGAGDRFFAGKFCYHLIADPNVNAVYVATPPGTHCEYALRVAASGKPAYVELRDTALNRHLLLCGPSITWSAAS